MNILSFFRKSAPSAPFTGDDAARMKLYKKLRFQSFIAGTVGYSLYYVCRTSLNVMKKPILDSGSSTDSSPTTATSNASWPPA